MGALVGLLFGLGCVLAWRSGSRAPARGLRTGPTLVSTAALVAGSKPRST